MNSPYLLLFAGMVAVSATVGALVWAAPAMFRWVWGWLSTWWP